MAFTPSSSSQPPADQSDVSEPATPSVSLNAASHAKKHPKKQIAASLPAAGRSRKRKARVSVHPAESGQPGPVTEQGSSAVHAASEVADAEQAADLLVPRTDFVHPLSIQPAQKSQNMECPLNAGASASDSQSAMVASRKDQEDQVEDEESGEALEEGGHPQQSQCREDQAKDEESGSQQSQCQEDQAEDEESGEAMEEGSHSQQSQCNGKDLSEVSVQTVDVAVEHCSTVTETPSSEAPSDTEPLDNHRQFQGSENLSLSDSSVHLQQAPVPPVGQPIQTEVASQDRNTVNGGSKPELAPVQWEVMLAADEITSDKCSGGRWRGSSTASTASTACRSRYHQGGTSSVDFWQNVHIHSAVAEAGHLPPGEEPQQMPASSSSDLVVCALPVNFYQQNDTVVYAVQQVTTALISGLPMGTEARPFGKWLGETVFAGTYDFIGFIPTGAGGQPSAVVNFIDPIFLQLCLVTFRFSGQGVAELFFAQGQAEINAYLSTLTPEGEVSSIVTSIVSQPSPCRRAISACMALLEPSVAASSEQAVQRNAHYKTRLCRFVASRGYCNHGAACAYAHTEEELRPAPR
jgi:hypothetical protein